ncbi:L-asparagine permease [Escherichia coli]
MVPQQFPRLRVLHRLAFAGQAAFIVIAVVDRHAVAFTGMAEGGYLVPSRVFEIVLNFASLGIIASWAFIIVCQMRLRKAIKEGKAADVSFKLPGAPFTSWLTLLFLLSVLVLMAFDYPNGTYTIAALPIIGILLVIGWFGVRKRVAEIHSTAPVVEEDEEKQEIVFKPETAS